jgi:antitoxin component of MazEF toxin-antitoxin module
VSLEGGSLAVHIPKSWGAAQGIGKGSKVVLEFLSDGSILIRRADKNE